MRLVALAMILFFFIALAPDWLVNFMTGVGIGASACWAFEMMEKKL